MLFMSRPEVCAIGSSKGNTSDCRKSLRLRLFLTYRECIRNVREEWEQYSEHLWKKLQASDGRVRQFSRMVGRLKKRNMKCAGFTHMEKYEMRNTWNS
jgi:hypothetical protein